MEIVGSELKLATGLLHSCRQVYHEAVSILYCQNKFVVSGWYGQPYFQRWSEQLSGRVHLLRNIKIDCTTLAFQRHKVRQFGVFKAYDVLPVLRLSWSESKAMLQVSFSADLGSTETIEFTTTFNAIAQGDQLNIKGYSAFERLLASVTIRQDGKVGVVTFANATPTSNVQCTFNHSKNGKLIMVEARGTQGFSAYLLPSILPFLHMPYIPTLAFGLIRTLERYCLGSRQYFQSVARCGRTHLSSLIGFKNPLSMASLVSEEYNCQRRPVLRGRLGNGCAMAARGI
jgi:hypothetical protein